MSYEAWRITYQSSEQAARAAYTEWQVKLEEVKKWMSLAEAVALGFEACQRRMERTEKLECAANPQTEMEDGRFELLRSTEKRSEKMKAIEKLRAVLCDADGNVCCAGSDGDRKVIAEALAEAQAA